MCIVCNFLEVHVNAFFTLDLPIKFHKLNTFLSHHFFLRIPYSKI